MKDIVLNERAKAEELLAGTAKIEDIKVAISLLVRYDVQVNHMDADSVREHVRQTIYGLYPKVARSKIDHLIDYYIKNAEKYPLSAIDGVPITQKELDIVLSRDGIRAQCLTFALLALAKCDTIRCPDVKYWYSGKRWNELMARANLVLSEDDMCDILHYLYKDGHIGLAERIDNCSMQVLFADEAGEPVMVLQDSDFRDLGYCLRAHVGQRYTRCEECDRWIKQTKNGRRRYYDDCAAVNHRNASLRNYHKTKIS